MKQTHSIAVESTSHSEKMTVQRLLHELDPVQRQSVKISQKSYFRDNIWDFSEEYPDEHLSEVRCRLDLKTNVGCLTDKQNSRLLDTFKCLFYSLIYDPPHVGVHFPSVKRAVVKGHGLGNLFCFMAENGIQSLRAVTEDDFEEFLASMQELPNKNGKQVSDRTLHSRVRGIEWIGLQGGKLADTFTFTPWKEHRSNGRWALSVAEKIADKGRLSTEPWSDKLIADLVRCSLLEIARMEERLTGEAVSKGKNKPKSKAKGFLNKKEQAQYVRTRGAVGLLAGTFSGMRVRELCTLSGDLSRCCKIEDVRNGDHDVRGHYLHGILKKRKPVAVEEKWQTIPVVHQSIGTLVKANAAFWGARSYLFCSSKVEKNGDVKRRMATNSFVGSLNLLANFHGVDLSEINGRISAFDMRRTFARVVTRNGLGVLELRDQLKHIDPNLSMRYGAPGLKEYLESEKQNFTADQYRELLSGQDSLIGGGALEFSEARLAFSGLRRAERDTFLKNLPKSLVVDQTADGLCLYRPDRALCGGDKWACKPADCKNSIIHTEEYLKTVTFREQENIRLLKFYARQPAKREHLKAQQAVIAKLKAQIAVSHSSQKD